MADDKGKSKGKTVAVVAVADDVGYTDADGNAQYVTRGTEFDIGAVDPGIDAGPDAQRSMMLNVSVDNDRAAIDRVRVVGAVVCLDHLAFPPAVVDRAHRQYAVAQHQVDICCFGHPNAERVHLSS